MARKETHTQLSQLFRSTKQAFGVEFFAGGFQGPQWREAECSYYGNLAKVAARFYITTGNYAELDAAYVYACRAAHTANL